MANNYFQFKQFTILQNQAAMKVGTDGVLLGAWANCSNSQRALDIGTGTGLIALMMAQRNLNLTIDAIDIDANAIADAHKNFNSSSWANRLFLHHVSLQNFITKDQVPYDLIVTNPPFFINSLKPNHESRSQARHTDTLSTSALFFAVKQLLQPNGRFCAIIPTEILPEYKLQGAIHLLNIIKLTWIKTTPTKAPKRVLIEYTFQSGLTHESTLIIEDKGRHQYSDDYKSLTQNFYLNF